MIESLKYLMIIFLLALVGCSEDKFDDEVELYSLTVHMGYPENYSVYDVEGVRAKLVNVTNKLESFIETDKNGIATFQNVPVGTYRLSGQMIIPAEKAKELGDTLVTDDDISKNKYLNLGATVNSIYVTDHTTIDSLEMRASIPGDLLIKEIFYTGTTTPNNKKYVVDQFIELYNNTDQTIYLDNLHIATVYGGNGVSSSSEITVFQEDRDHVYLAYVWKVPGSGKSNPLLPGKSFIIAQDGMKHKTDPKGNPNSIDLDRADYETYVVRDNQRDVDFAEVPNMTEVFFTTSGTYDFLYHTAGPAVVIFQVQDDAEIETIPDPKKSTTRKLMKIPSNWILDAFEALAFSDKGGYKRIPPAFDAGFIFCNKRYEGESCRRKVDSDANGRIILQDTNNSGEDFEVIPFPTPRIFH